MASLNDIAGIFTGDCLDAFNEMEAAVLASGDVSGTQARVIPLLLAIIADKQSAPDAANPHAATDTSR